MKKLLLLALTAFLVSCHPMEDPLKYKGCVVVGKWEHNPRMGNIYLKLTPELRKDFEEDYILIGVPEWELNKLNIGDTIK